MSLHLVRAGLDWLQVSFAGTLHADVLTTFERLKTVAQGHDVPQPFMLGPIEFMVHPRGRAHWSYVLKNPEVELCVSRNAKPGAPVLAVRLTAFGLANTKPAVLWELVTTFLPELGSLAQQSVSRADVAVDVQGLDPTDEMMRNIVCAASYRGTHGTAKKTETYQFGRRDVLLRVYDKRAEIAVSDKDWVEDSWRFAAGYDAELPVHRVEVQLRRKALAELGFDTAEQVLTRPGALLDYGLSWANLRVPTSDATKTRWPEDPKWTAIRKAVFDGAALQRVTRPAELMSLNRTVRNFLGCIARAGAYFETTDFIDAAQRLSFAAEVHMMQEGLDFGVLVENNRRRIVSEGV